MEVRGHETVLLHEAVLGLRLVPGALVVDATGGVGGHSARILEEIGDRGTLIILERDPTMAKKLQERFIREEATVHVVCEDFRNIAQVVAKLGFEQVDGVLADLGWNSEQFEAGGRGFSFRADEPLLMTYDDPQTAPFTARDMVNSWSEEALADALYAYADERFARRIAREIVDSRKNKEIASTHDLVAIIERAVPKRFQRGRLHPATKTFQALRIAVNDELEALSQCIEGALGVLRPQGRLAVITFHSIEDRVVKERFRELAKEGAIALITKKPVTPSRTEIIDNPRARSAHLRIAEKIS